MAYDDNSPQTVHPMASVAEGYIKGLTLKREGPEQGVDLPREMTVEEELDGLSRMMDEYQALTENIEQTKRRIQEKLEVNGNRFSKLYEHQELIKRGEYAAMAELSTPTRSRF